MLVRPQVSTSVLFHGLDAHSIIWVVVKKYGPFLGTLNIRCRTIIGTQEGTIILNNHPFVSGSQRNGLVNFCPP